MAKARKTLKEPVEQQAGCWAKRNEIILALCNGGVAAMSHYNADPNDYGKFIVRTANAIVEEIYNE